MERHALRDDQFARIEHLLPGRPGAVGRNSDLGNRLFVDALGNPLRLSLTGGQVHDNTQAEALLGLIEPGALLADKGYDADHCADSLIARAIKVVIPPKSNRKVKRDCDYALYCERNLVERFFCIIKHFRGIATRYEKTARNFLAGLHLVCALAWLK